MEAQTRFLVALPLLIAAEVLVHKQLRLIVWQFIDRDIITDKALPRFWDAIASAIKLRNSVPIELILLLLAFLGGQYLWSTVTILGQIASEGGSWYASVDRGDIHLFPAGYWYIFIS